jgi:hypothetical protein
VEPLAVQVFYGQVVVTPPTPAVVHQIRYDGGDSGIYNIFGGPLLPFFLPVPY